MESCLTNLFSFRSCKFGFRQNLSVSNIISKIEKTFFCITKLKYEKDSNQYPGKVTTTTVVGAA